jgi:hypothetical protein
MPATERRIYGLSATCVLLAAVALILPRFVPNREGGFASAASAILVFLAILGGAALLSVYLLVVTLQTHRSLAPRAKVAGFAPAVILVTAFAFLMGFLRY